MEQLNIDLTSFGAAHQTFTELFGIEDEVSLISDYYLSRDRDEVTLADFMRFAGITKNPLEHKSMNLASLHVTTNEDSCEAIRKYGLLDLQRAVVEETSLKHFLQEHGISIFPDQYLLKHNGNIYNLNPHSTGYASDNERGLLDYISYKLYRDYPVCGFISSNNVLGYGGMVNRRPEFLNNVSRLLDLPELVSGWERRTTTYILKFRISLARYESPSEVNYIGDLIVKTVFDYLFHGGPACDVYSFLKNGEIVLPEEIIEFFTVEEFNRYLND